MTVCIIGIDCATDPANVGLARGFLTGDDLIIDRLAKPVKGESVSDLVSAWIDSAIPTLLGLDAPLGWPASLGEQLNGHSAGNLIAMHSNDLFRRYTDKFIKTTIGKQPLDVGADRIARTAIAALQYLDGIGQLTGQRIPLAWSAALTTSVSAIEVYPAATLKLSGCRSSGYKKNTNTQERREILDVLSGHIRFSVDPSFMLKDDDVLDAAVCVLAASHFLRDQCMPPDDPELARKEGWIWVRQPVNG